MAKEIKALARAFIKAYIYKDFYLDNERYGILDITREVAKVVDIANGNEIVDLDEYIRSEIAKVANK